MNRFYWKRWWIVCLLSSKELNRSFLKLPMKVQSPYEKKLMGKESNFMKKEIKIGVCKGRHEMPCDMYVFEEISDPTDVLWMKLESLRFFVNNFGDEFKKREEKIETPLKI